MKRKNNCLYTNMLKRLNMLDEQCSEMQASLAMVREWVTTKMGSDGEEEATEVDSLRGPKEEEGET